jgi:HlyD family type I secretion membrane fusion protein
VSAPADHNIHWRANAKTDSNPVIQVGFWSVGVVLIGFLLWATLFPLSSAVITPGTFLSDGKNKLIQHQRGGRVREIYVHEGDLVVAEQPILSLDPTQVQADLTQLQARHSSLLALKSRLVAERAGGLENMEVAAVTGQLGRLRGGAGIGFHDAGNLMLRGSAGKSIVVKDHLSKAGEFDELMHTGSTRPATSLSAGREFIDSQQKAYSSGRNLLAREIESFDKKVATLMKQGEGLQARVHSQQAMLDMNRREYERLRPLAQKGYVARNRLNERERIILEMEGTVVALQLDREGVGTQIEEVAVQIKKARLEYSNAAAQEYAKIVSELAELSDQLVAARNNVDDSIVRAPVSGTLARLLTTTVGGVVGAADLIGEIVPEAAPLVVQARVQPSDIDHVHIGQSAEIAVTAFNRRIDDKVSGRVVYKSADAEKDEKTAEPYFTVRLEIEDFEGKSRNRLKDIQAGMQSEVYIRTGSRTFMTYLAKPIVDSFRRAFREQ